VQVVFSINTVYQSWQSSADTVTVLYTPAGVEPATLECVA
jgi:hypothetical protein